MLLVLWSSGIKATSFESSASVIIIGGGISGLSAAYHLKQAGYKAIILEMSPHVGGRIRTAYYPDHSHAEIGLAEFWEHNSTLEIFRALNVPLETSYTSFSSFIHDGKLYPFTQRNNLEFLKSVLTASELESYQAWDEQVAELNRQLEVRPIDTKLLALKDISFSDWVKQHKQLSSKTQEFIRIESEPEYAVSWNRISALDGIAEWHIFSGKGETPYHVVGGNHRGALAIANYLGKKSIKTNQMVTHVKTTASGVEVITTDMVTYHQRRYRAKYVISTVPLFRLDDIQFNPPLNATIKEAIQTQTGGAYFSVHVELDSQAKQLWKLNGVSELPILTDGILGVIYEGKSTSDKQSLLNLLITDANAQRFNMRINAIEDIKKELLAEFEKLWPGFNQYVKQMTFYRYHPRAIASWPVGRSRFDQLSDELRKSHGRLYFAGDFTEGTHSDGAAKSALRVVKEIVSQLDDDKDSRAGRRIDKK